MNQKIVLSPKKILNKEFKIDFKGYNATEVDHFLDMVRQDYEAFAVLLNESYEKIEDLEKKIASQKQELAAIQREKALQDDSMKAMEENLTSNVDILKRLSLLEKAVYNQNK